MASNSNTLYVTFVDVDCNLLKIWGQKHRLGASYVEKQLMQLVPELNATRSLNPSLIQKGMFCYVKRSGDNYYRARVLSNVQDDSVGVIFIDYGNRDIIHISNIKIRGTTDDFLFKMAKQADEFYLAGVIAPVGGWTKEIIGAIRKDICNKELTCNEVAQIEGQKLIEVQYGNEDLSNYLVAKQMAQVVLPNVQSQMVMSLSRQSVVNSLANNHQHENMYSNPSQMGRMISGKVSPVERNVGKQFQHRNNEFQKGSNQMIYSSPTQFVQPDQLNPSIYNSNRASPAESYYNSLRNYMHENLMQQNRTPIDSLVNNQLNSSKRKPEQLLNNGVIEALAQHIKEYIEVSNVKSSNTNEENIPHNYVSNVLKVGSTHNVFISCVDDGPWSFSIQLVASEDELNKLMEELATAELVPVKPPIILGHPCIVASTIYGNLCRGVVVSISHTAAKVYLVDFGDTEDLAISLIYELPKTFFKTRVLSQKFSLTGLQSVPYSNEIKEYFKEVVQDKLLILKVASLEGDNLPCCELYIESKNIKRMLNEKIQNARCTVNTTDLEEGVTETVVVTWVDSLQRFYVQLHKMDSELNALKNELSQVETNTEKLAYNELQIGLHCICKYMEDGQWYRAKIRSITSQKSIGVFYIDYGNTETVDISYLRKINSDGLIAQMKSQAIQCCLHGFENQPYNKELSDTLENLTLEKDLKMNVVSISKDQISVKLFIQDKDVVPMIMKSSQETLGQSTNDKFGWLEGSNSNQSLERSPPGAFDKSKSYEKTKKSPNNLQNDVNRNEKSNWRTDNQKSRDGGFNVTKSNRGFKQDKENWTGKNSTSSSWERRQSSGGNKTNWNHKPSEKTSEFHADRKKFEDWRNDRKERNDSEMNDFNKKYDKRNKKHAESRSGPDVPERKKFPFEPSGSSGKIKIPEKVQKVRNPIPKDDLAPVGSHFEEKSVKIESTERVVITYYISPKEFYIQILTEEDDFKKMMEDIQIYYSDKYSIKHKLKEGDLVVAKFSYDDIIYRGEVVTCDPLVVRYVDYGNQEEVEQMKTWLITKQFVQLPKQAIKCGLSNLRPKDGQWPPLGSRLDEYFDSEEYKCTFVGCENGLYEVDLEAVNTGKNVAAEIIAGGFGFLKKQPLSIPQIDFSLLPKQILKVKVSQVHSINKFYVILNKDAEKELEKELKRCANDNELLKSVEESSLSENSIFLVETEKGCWKRAEVLSINDDTVSVYFIDEGSRMTQVARNKVRFVPHHLEEIQAQAVECCFNTLPESTSLDDFKTSVELKDVIISVISEDDKRLSVDLYKCENGSQFHSIGELPVLSQRLPVVISYVESPSEIYIQYRFNKDNLEELSNELFNFYENKPQVESFKGDSNDLIVAKTNSGIWGRGFVQSISPSGDVDVVFMDTGARKTVPCENVRILDSSFYRWDAFARKVYLDIESSSDSAEGIMEKLEALKQFDELFGYFINDNGKILIELVSHGVRITPTLFEKDKTLSKVDKFEKLMMDIDGNAEPEVELTQQKTEGLKVFVIHIDSPNKFWIHKESCIADFQKFQEKLQELCQVLPNKENPKDGDVVAATFGDVWYRAVTLSVVEKLLTVKFLDYGNVVEVDLNSESVKELPSDIVEVPIFTSQFSLRGKWKEEATAKFEEAILEYEDPVTAVVLEEGNPVVVDLFKDGKSITEELLVSGMGVDEARDEVKDDNDLTTVYVTHVESLSNFYIQKHSSTETLENISKRLSEMSVEEVFQPKENEIHAAKFLDDGLWYRAKVLAELENGFQVLFVDYGNVSIVNEVARLAEDLKTIPFLSENCSLVRGQKVDVWSEEACKRFGDYADGRPLQMEVVAVDVNKKPIVKLFSEGENVSEELAKFCESDARFQAQVTHVNSSNDFYLRRTDDNQFRAINRALESVELEKLIDLQPGTLCLAGGFKTWRRAKFLRNLEQNFEVFLIDYGKCAVVDELKKPLNDLLEIPPTIIRCRANVPEKMEEEFLKFAGNGNENRVFRVRILEAGEINLVSLKLNGVIFEELLNSCDDDADERKSEYSKSLSSPDADETKDDENLQNDALNEDIEENFQPKDFILENETGEEKQVNKSSESVGLKTDGENECSAILSGNLDATDNEVMEEEFEDTLDEMPEKGSKKFEIVQEIADSKDSKIEEDIETPTNVENYEDSSEVISSVVTHSEGEEGSTLEVAKGEKDGI